MVARRAEGCKEGLVGFIGGVKFECDCDDRSNVRYAESSMAVVPRKRISQLQGDYPLERVNPGPRPNPPYPFGQIKHF